MAILEFIFELLSGLCDLLTLLELTGAKGRTVLWIGLTILSVVITILVAVWTLK